MDNLYFKVINKVGVSLIFTIIGAIIGYLIIPPEIAVFAPFITLIALIIAFFVRKSNIGMGLVYSISLLMGIGIYPSIVSYTNQIGATLVIGCFAITCLMFFTISIYGYKSNKDFSYMETFLCTSLIILILVSILGIFIHATLLQIVISIASIIIFMGYILYDSNVLMKRCYSEDDIPTVVLNLYLDFLNLFLQLLSLVSEINGDD